MSVFIIAAVTADGFIAQDAEHLADWTSAEDKKVFVELTKKAGVMIMGHTTFKTIGRALPGRRTVVMTRQQLQLPDLEATTEEPGALIARLHSDGFKDIAICGGQQIYTLFMKAGLVDRLYLTLEPKLFGAGMTLFNDALDCTLQLANSRQLNRDTLLLEYEVL